MRSGVLSRQVSGISKSFSILRASFACLSNSLWNRESATPNIAAMTSRSDFPRKSAIPYSVTTISRKSWNGGVAVIPKDIGGHASVDVAGSAHHDNGPCIVESKTLRHEIVLAADAADDFPIVQSIISLAVTDALGNQLSDHIDLAVKNIVNRVRIVGRDITALRRGDIGARLFDLHHLSIACYLVADENRPVEIHASDRFDMPRAPRRTLFALLRLTTWRRYKPICYYYGQGPYYAYDYGGGPYYGGGPRYYYARPYRHWSEF
jgi:hypothetical protein